MTRPFATLLLLLAAAVVVDGFRVPMAMSASKTKKTQQTPAASEPQKAAALRVRMPPAIDDEGSCSTSSSAYHQPATLEASSLDSLSAKCSIDSPFHCVIEDELGRPRSEARPQGDGRSWHASLQFPSAQQILADASRLRSVSKDLLQDALHYLEYVSLFGKGNKDKKEETAEAEETEANKLLDGTWRLAFNSGGAFPLKGARQDRWGYLKDEVEVRIDTAGSVATILVDAFAKRFEGTLAPVPGARRNTLALDFSRVQLLKGSAPKKQQQPSTPTPMLAPGELKLVNAILRPGARLHLISVAASHLALRFTPPSSAAEASGEGPDAEASSSLLVFSRTTAAKPKSKAKAAAVAAPAAPVAKAAPPAVVSKSKAGEGEKGKAMKPRFKKPLKGTPSNPYSSFFEYLEDECVPLYLALSFPTFAKHLPHIAHAARFKLMLLQELWVEVARHWPFHH